MTATELVTSVGCTSYGTCIF